MQREIAITELKPVLAAQGSHRAHEAPAPGFTAPDLRGIGLAGQRIEQRLDVRRDREHEMLEIVAGVDEGGGSAAGRGGKGGVSARRCWVWRNHYKKKQKNTTEKIKIK